LPATWDGGPVCGLSARDSRRLTSVLRLGPGDSFPAIGQDGSTYLCTIEHVERGRVRLSVRSSLANEVSGGYKPDVRARSGREGQNGYSQGVESVVAIDSKPSVPSPHHDVSGLPRIILAVGMLKGAMLDDVVRAAAEAGVVKVIPLTTRRTIPGQGSPGRMERLRRVVSEAIGQSGSGVPTAVAEAITIEQLCSALPPAPGKRLSLFFHESPLAHGTLHRYCNGILEEMVICVGPEGGFDDAEVACFLENGFVPAWLGPTVLRAGTAAIFAIASLRIVCLERSSWSMIESIEYSCSGSRSM
jgi:RsmE family RNA methyltransferase